MTGVRGAQDRSCSPAPKSSAVPGQALCHQSGVAPVGYPSALPYTPSCHAPPNQSVSQPAPSKTRVIRHGMDEVRREADHRRHAVTRDCMFFRDWRRPACVIDTRGNTRSSPKLSASSLSRPERTAASAAVSIKRNMRAVTPEVSVWIRALVSALVRSDGSRSG